MQPDPNDPKLRRTVEDMMKQMQSSIGSLSDLSTQELTQAKQSGQITNKERVAELWRREGESDYAEKMLAQGPPQTIRLNFPTESDPSIPRHLSGMTV